MTTRRDALIAKGFTERFITDAKPSNPSSRFIRSADAASLGCAHFWPAQLPNKSIIWYEAYINYRHGFRDLTRILYSNDGLIFVTYDHYVTFIEIV